MKKFFEIILVVVTIAFTMGVVGWVVYEMSEIGSSYMNIIEEKIMEQMF
jgi:hypothetical protein